MHISIGKIIWKYWMNRRLYIILLCVWEKLNKKYLQWKKKMPYRTVGKICLMKHF